MKSWRLNPPQIVVLGFFAVIMAGALFLHLPVASSRAKEASFINSLFTATSATCVTGLTVKDIGSFYSPFGKLVLLFLMEIGGLGIMTLSTVFAILLGRKLTLSQNITVQSALDHSKVEGLNKLILYVVLFTLSIEVTGVLILCLRWMHTMQWGFWVSFKKAVFHAVSAFCNAGLVLFPDNLSSFRSDWVVMATVCSLIVIGGAGFVVFLDITKLKFWRKDRRLLFSRMHLQTKLVFWITLILIVGGAVGIYLFENSYALKGMPAKEKFWSCLFTSITPRTAGFNVLPTGDLRPVTLFMTIILMFIGASPGSTGGGIKTVTFGILIASFLAALYNRDRVTFFGRTIPRQIYRKTLAVAFLGLAVVLLSTFLLSIAETGASHSSDFFLSILFESTSAFGTVGLSMGITPNLTNIGKLIIIFNMFIGRVGPLTLALAIAMRKERIVYRYPEEPLMVG